MGFHGLKIDDDFNIISILRRSQDANPETVCIDCAKSVTPITSYKVTKTVGRMPKEIPDPQGRRDPLGNILTITIYIPKTVKGRMCCSCVQTLRADNYVNKKGETIGVFKNADDHNIQVHYENKPNETVEGSELPSKAEKKPVLVREIRLTKDETVYVKIAPDPEDLKADPKSFNKFGFSGPRDYRKFIRG